MATKGISNKSFTTTLLVKQSPAEVFNAIINVRGWWSEQIVGGTEKLNDEFDYRYKDVHRCKIKLVEVVPGKKVVWQVLDNYFNFIKDEKEWTGTKMIFGITPENGGTQLTFTHEGLVPAFECYNACQDGWTNYITKSLRDLIVTGKGEPNPKEGGYNEELVKNGIYNNKKIIK